MCFDDVLTRICARGAGWPKGFSRSWKKCEITSKQETCVPIVRTGLKNSPLSKQSTPSSILTEILEIIDQINYKSCDQIFSRL